MGRDYSKQGCTNCKRRRKKCDENKPQCSACSRMQLDCSYETSEAASYKRQLAVRVDVRPLPLPPPQVTVQALPAATFRDEEEEYILYRIPSTALSFYSPTSSEAAKDLKDLWQLMYQDDLVRNSLIACFSVVLGSIGEPGPLKRSSYGKALTLLRSELTQEKSDLSVKAPVAVNFIGLMEATGPETQVDPLDHWRAMISLIDPFLFRVAGGHLLSKSVGIMLMESMFFHLSCTGFFSKSLLVTFAQWKESRIREILDRVNPPGPRRPSHSPFLSGQYLLYDVMLEVAVLYRYKGSQLLDDVDVNETEMTLLAYRAQISGGDVFGSSIQADSTRALLQKEYQLISMVCQICIDALRTPSQTLVESVDKSASSALKGILELPLLPISHSGLVWAIQMLLLAIRRENDFQRLTGYINKIQMFLDPGHRARIKAFVEAVKTRRIVQGSGADQGGCFPPCLSILEKPGGVLS